ncbi:MAG: ROK family protein, partial [Myxococcales bacterium]
MKSPDTNEKLPTTTTETAPPAPGADASTLVLQRPNTLCIDVGGTGLKSVVLDANGKMVSERQRIDTPRPATPASLMAVIAGFLRTAPEYDRVSVGFPGVVKQNVVHTAPNLDGGWEGFALGAEIEKLGGKPTRVLNDAGVQGYGVITGQGVEMILTLGTGMGCALFVNGTYVPNLELAHHPLRKGQTYEDTIDNATLLEIGRKRWNKRLRRIIHQVLPIFNPDVLYLGGGNAKQVRGDLPAQVKLVDNMAGLLGGIALWRYGVGPAAEEAPQQTDPRVVSSPL